MISERRAFLDSVAKEEEQLVFLQARRELLTTSLKNKYTLREGIEKDLKVARDNRGPSWEQKTRDVLYGLAGTQSLQKARAGIRHNFAADLQEKLRNEIPVMEEEVRELIALRSDAAKALDTLREKEAITRRELEEYMESYTGEPKRALEAYQTADRTWRLLSAAAESGRTYYTYLRALNQQMKGAEAVAARPVGLRPYFDMLLQRAYTRQGEQWAESAESLQLEFLTDLRTLDAMTPHKFRTAGQMAFSPRFFDTTMTKLLTLRKGDELNRLLDEAAADLAALLLKVEEARAAARTARDEYAEGAGLVM